MVQRGYLTMEGQLQDVIADAIGRSLSSIRAQGGQEFLGLLRKNGATVTVERSWRSLFCRRTIIEIGGKKYWFHMENFGKDQYFSFEWELLVERDGSYFLKPTWTNPSWIHYYPLDMRDAVALCAAGIAEPIPIASALMSKSTEKADQIVEFPHDLPILEDVDCLFNTACVLSDLVALRDGLTDYISEKEKDFAKANP